VAPKAKVMPAVAVEMVDVEDAALRDNHKVMLP
jgi:hypothetical protein